MMLLQTLALPHVMYHNTWCRTKHKVIRRKICHSVNGTNGQVSMKSDSDMSEYTAFSAALEKVLKVSRLEMKTRLENGKKRRRKAKSAGRASRAKG